MRNLFFALLLSLMPIFSQAQAKYSDVQVDEESSLNLTQITSDNEYVIMPEVKKGWGGQFYWYTNSVIDVSKDGQQLAYLSLRNKESNIFVKDLTKNGASIQRTNRKSILDLSYSPDGEFLCFSEPNGNTIQVYQTNAKAGYVCRQITSGNFDYTPIYTPDMKNIFFSRSENNNFEIWGFDVNSHLFSSYTIGINPCPVDANSLLFVRMTPKGKGEIWRIDYQKGMEECVVSDPKRSFTTPSISPDGKWILMVGSSLIDKGPRKKYPNTDIFVSSIDGSNLIQLTYHPADDISPVWGKDGKSIYFISQRGSSKKVANVWRIDFIR